MKRMLIYPLLLLLAFAFSGCSVQHMYIIRNSSKVPVEIILAISGKDTSYLPDLEISSAQEIVPLKKSAVTTSFIGKIAGARDENGACKFVVPPGHSVNISSLVEQLKPGLNAANGFNGGSMEIKFGKSALLFGNNIAEVHQIFKFKSFFWGGPWVYYLDLE